MKKIMGMILFLAFLVFPAQAFVQTLGDDYDRREGIIDPFEEEDKMQEEERIDEIINRIKKGDRTILRLILFETFEKVHAQVTAEEEKTGRSFFSIVGGPNSLAAFVGGFDNQDPKVRLKSIGYLGHWVEEIGENMKFIEKSVDKKLATNLETTGEVRYAYRLLKMKIVRKDILGRLKKGDQQALVTVSPEEFLPLVFYEPRIRTIYLGSSSAVKIRSILLDPAVEGETGNVAANKSPRPAYLDIERICYTGGSVTGTTGSQSEVMQAMILEGKDPKKMQAASASDTSEASTTVVRSHPVRGKSILNWNCVRAIYTGLDNKSQFVREHAARIFLNYVRGYTGDKNYLGDVSGKARSVHREMLKVARNPYYVRIAQVAWDNVKWSEYYYSDRFTSMSDIMPLVRSRYYLEYQYNKDANPDTQGNYQPVGTQRYFTKDVQTYPEWGTEMVGAYRNDVKEVLRVLGLSWYIDPEYVVPRETTSFKGTLSGVTTLFNDPERNKKSPDRSDRIEGEFKRNS